MKLKPIPRALHCKFFPSLRIHTGEVPGDGSCFFHSVACALNLKDYQNESWANQTRIGHLLREKVMKHLTKGDGRARWGRFWGKLPKQPFDIPDYSSIVSRAKDTSQWATAPLIVYAMAKLKLNYLFVDAETNELYCGVVSFHLKRRPLVAILWVNHSHFEPMFVGKESLFYPSSKPFQTIKEAYGNSSCSRGLRAGGKRKRTQTKPVNIGTFQGQGGTFAKDRRDIKSMFHLAKDKSSKITEDYFSKIVKQVETDSMTDDEVVQKVYETLAAPLPKLRKKNEDFYSFHKDTKIKK